jgi:gliding motility-associated-like protein
MKRLLPLLLSSLILLLITENLHAVEIKLTQAYKSVSTCKAVFVSSGYDVSGTFQENYYTSSESGRILTITSGGGPIRVNFTYANFLGSDKMEIWDGTWDGVSFIGPKLGTLTGYNNDKVFTSNTGHLTFRFTGTNNPYNDQVPDAAGWQGLIGCLPTGCDGNLPASDVCSSAPTICNLDGYCGSTSGWYTADNRSALEGSGNPLNICYDPNTGNYGATIQNNSWLAFIANSTTASLTIKSSNCSDANRGMQAMVLATTNCTSFTSKSSCIYNGVGTFNLNATGLTVGTKYYIMIDGGFGNDCDYTVSANTGIKTVTASADATTICEGQSVNLTASGGTSYQWSDGVTSIPAGANATVSPTTTRTYTCTVNATCGTEYPTVKVTVKPKPVVTANPTSQTLCSGGTTSIGLTSTVNPVNFKWTTTKTGGTVTGNADYNPGGANATISQTLTATSNTAGVVTYSITPTANGCVGSPITVPVTVNPVPTLTVTPTSQTFCAGGTTGIALTSNVAGTTYGWTTTTVTNVSGSSSPGTGTPIAQTLTATATTAGTVVYEVTPTAAGCAGTKKTATITVNPRPTITPTATSQTICSGSSTSIGLTSDISGTTYSWTTVVTGGVTGSSNGSGSNIVQTLNTNGTNVGTVEYTITATTPAPAGCTNSAVTKVLVTVNPIPTISIGATSSTICNGGSTTLTATVAPAGGTFLWTPGNATTNPIVVSPTSSTSYNCQYTVNGCSNSTSKNITVNQLPANVAITPNPGSASICNGKSITLTASSSDAGGTYLWAPGGATTSAITVSPGANTTYTVTYTLPTTCAQTATQAVTVKTVPTVTVTPTAGTICNGASTTLNTNVSSGGGTYLWSPGGSTATSITVSPTSTTTYSLTYTATNACASAVKTTTVTVTPKDDAGVTYASTYCKSGPDPSPTMGTALAGGIFSATPAGMTINATTGQITFASTTSGTYAVKYTTNGSCPNSKTQNVTVTNALNADFIYNAATFCQYAANPLPNFNTGGSAGTFSAAPAGLVFVNANTGEIDLNASTPGNYTIKNDLPAAGLCLAATSAPFNLTITAAPVLNATSFTPSVCSPGGPNVTLSGGNTYAWTVNSPVTITGATPGNGTLINQTLTTTDSIPGIVHYIVTPTGATGCAGKVDTVNVTVNPVPDVNATPVTPSVCSGLVTDIKLTSGIPAATFSWTVPTSINANGASNGSGNVIAQVLTATTANPGTVIYRITPKSFTCDGNYIDVTVNVNPNPTTTITIPPADQTICSGETTNIHLTSSTGSTNFAWTVNQTGVTGAVNGTGTDINQLLTVIGSNPGKAIYTITGSANGCSGAMAIDSVMVNPIPVLQVTPLKQEICSGTATNIALVSNLGGTTFSWKVYSSTITGGSDGSTVVGNIIQTLTNPGSVVDSITYKIIATAGGCSSALDPLVDSVAAVITVNPKPIASTPTPVTLCSGDSTKIAINSNVTGSTFTYKAFTVGVIGSGDGAGDSIKQTLSVLSGIDSVIYTITPTSLQGCIGNPFSTKVIVNATPEITFTPSPFQSVCSGTAVSVDLISSVPGTTISWTPRASTVIGTQAGSGLTPAHIGDVLSITTDTAVSVIYDVTAVSAKGCLNAPLSSMLKFTVNPLPKVIPVIKSTTICDGDSLIVPLTSNVTGTDFTWTVTQTNVTGATAVTNDTEIRQKLKLTTTTAGTVVYSITSNSPQGCHNSTAEQLTITVNPLDDAAFHYSAIKYCQSEVDPTAIRNGGTSGTFTSIPTGIIFTNATTGTIDLSATPPGFYNITYSTNGACKQSSNIPVTINANPTADTSKIKVIASACGSQSGSITGITGVTGIAPIKYEWTNSTGTKVSDSLLLDSITPGVYKLTITDATGCSLKIGNGNSLNIQNLKTITAKFTSDVTEGEIPLPVQFTYSNETNYTGLINYNWNFDNGHTSTVRDPLETFTEIGKYNVCLIVDDGGIGCRDTACAPNPIDATTSTDISIVPNVFTPNGDGVNDILKITAVGLSTVNAQIYNRWGQKEYEWSTLNGGWDGYSVSGLPATPGTYYIVLIAVGADRNKTSYTIKQSFTLLR